MRLVELVDSGRSGFTGSHAQFGDLARFLALVRTHQVPSGSYLVIEAMDRLSREAIHIALERLISLINAGIRVVTLGNGRVYDQESVSSDPGGLMIALVEMYAANNFSRSMGIRVAKAWMNKRQRLQDGDLRPVTRRCPGWLKVKGGKFEVIEEKADIVRKIFSLSRDGLGRYAITKILNRDKIPTMTGKTGWHSSAVTKILENHSVYGRFQPGLAPKDKGRVPIGDPVDDYYPAIVSKEDFFAEKSARDQRTGGGGRTVSGVRSAVAGLAFCACGAAMRRRSRGFGSKKSGPVRLVCATIDRALPCPYKSNWKYDAVIELLLDHDPVGIAQELARQHDTFRAEVAALEAKVTAAARRVDRWTSAMNAGDDPDVVQQFVTAKRDHKEALAARDSALARFADLDQAETVYQIGPARKVIETIQEKDDDEAVRAARLRQTFATLYRRLVFSDDAVWAELPTPEWVIAMDAQAAAHRSDDDPPVAITPARMTIPIFSRTNTQVLAEEKAAFFKELAASLDAEEDLP